jgi:alanine racemase
VSSIQQKFAVHTRPNWAEISLSALAENYRTIADHLGNEVTPCCVIKCDAYGHGVIECGRALEASGARWLGVTSTEEGVAVRESGVRLPILVMTGFWRGEEKALLEHGLTPAIATAEHVTTLEAAARSLGLRKSVPVHLKIDTGMSRLGVSLEELPSLAARIAASQLIDLQGVFSHLAESELLGSPSVPHQQAVFTRALDIVATTGQRPRFCHLANTAATVARPETWYNMVRPGLALYGYNLRCKGPGSELAHLPLLPILTWKTRIIAMRDIAASTPVGYNQRWTASRPTRLAVVPVGYGDGLNRHLSNCGQLIVHDRYAPIRGNVSMDLTMIDVTDIPQTAIGDEVIIIGSTEHCSVGADDQAYLANTIVYEILCGLSPRVPRVYVE